MHPRLRRAALGVTVIVGAASLGTGLRPATAQAAYPGTNGRIVFSSDRIDPGYYDIWTMASNGSDLDQLTVSPGADLDATWSPGGTLIAFTRYESVDLDDGEIWLMNADGSGLKRLTNHAADDFNPTFSPDGAKLAFASNRDGDYEIHTMKLDGTGVTQLTHNTYTDLWPAWSPSLNLLVYSSDDLSGFNIWTLNPQTGGSETRETSYGPTYQMVNPAWTPDGAWAVFTMQTHGIFGELEDADIARFEVSGGTDVFIHNSTDLRWNPHVSPDGQLIAYAAADGSEDLFDVFTMADEGGSEVNLTQLEAADDVDPDWQPIPSFPLVDARFSSYKLDIEWAYAEGITTGCTEERYCPNDNVTRAQMASFLARALDLPATANDYFTDDEGNIHEANINKLAAAGITTGCDVDLYCPTQNVSRAQMASFLARALDLPATTNDYFNDDETSIHEANINKLAAAGITTGCAADMYCPSLNVSRGQMAAFLHRALD